MPDRSVSGEQTKMPENRTADMLAALKSAEAAEAALIGEWANFWDVAPQPLIDKLMEAQRLRNIAINKPIPSPAQGQEEKK